MWAHSGDVLAVVVLLCPLCCFLVFWVHTGLVGKLIFSCVFPLGCDRGVHGHASSVRAYQERTRWDPKDGELCLARMKPEETLVEVRSDSDVQIDRLSWV